MRRSWAAALTLAWLSLGCGPPEERFELRGTVVSVDIDAGRVSVKHQHIPGLMEAMTMSFRVVDRKKLSTLRPDDPIEAVLVVKGRASWLEHITLAEEQARERSQAGRVSAWGNNAAMGWNRSTQTTELHRPRLAIG